MSFDPAILLIVLVCVLSLVVHECAHGLVALWNGDTTARDQGRITLNPLPHLHRVGSVLLPLALLLARAPVLFGWARPVPVDHSRLNNPRRDAVRVALAGPASNFILAIAFSAVARVVPEGDAFRGVQVAALAGVVWNCALGLFNLIPIPPLDGSWALMHFLRLRHIIALHQFRGLGLLLVAALMTLPPSRELFRAPLRGAVALCLGLFGIGREALP